jgi:hypothetical protein
VFTELVVDQTGETLKPPKPHFRARIVGKPRPKFYQQATSALNVQRGGGVRGVPLKRRAKLI